VLNQRLTSCRLRILRTVAFVPLNGRCASAAFTAGAAAAAVLLQPAVVRGAVTVSLGASGAIFGLFAVSVLTRLSWDPRKLLEGLILGNFVVRQVRDLLKYAASWVHRSVAALLCG
jgi:membrane associated rhomboid family serine protease